MDSDKTSSGPGHLEQVHFQFFGRARELVRCGEETRVDFPCGDYTRLSLKLRVLNIFPQLVSLRDSLEISVNAEYLPDNTFIPVTAGSTISIIPYLTEAEKLELWPQHDHQKYVVKFIFFGHAGDSMKSRTTLVPFSCGRYSGYTLKLEILRRFPHLDLLKDHLILALNEQYITESETVIVKADDTLAVIPSLSGG